MKQTKTDSLLALVISLGICVVLIAGCTESPTAEQLVARAVSQRAKEEHAAAIVHLKNALQIQPANAEARFLLGRSLMAIGDFKSAEPELRKAIESGWPKEEAIPPLARCMLVQGRYQELLYEIAADAVPDSVELHTVRGLAHLALGRIEQSRALFDEVLKRVPEHADALLGLARIAAKERQAESAARLIDRAIAADPRSIDAWLLKGELHVATSRLDAAAAAYEKLLSMYPGNVAALTSLAAIRVGEGNVGPAAQYAARATKLAPDNPQAHYLTALAAYRRNGKNDAAAARQAIGQALRLRPANPSFQLLAGTILASQGAWEDALTPLRWLLEKTPVHVPARKLYGAAMVRTGRAVGALSVLIPTLQLAPEDATLHAIIGDAHLRQGNFAKAAEHLDKAVAVTPAKASARSAIGLVPFVAFDQSRSLADIERALLATRDYAEPHRLLAIAHLQAGKYDQALKSIAVVAKDHPREPDLLALKGTALVGKKDFVAGRAVLEAALAIDPEHAPATVKLAHLDVVDGRPEQGRQRIATFLARYPKNVEALVGVAAIGPMLGAKDSEIVGWLERAKEVRPRETQILMMLVFMHLRMNEQAKVAAIAAELAKYGSNRTDVKWVLGIAQLETGDAPAAVSTFSALLAAQPDSPEVMRLLAESTLRASNYVNTAQATMLLTKALALKPGYVDALIALIEIDVRANRLPQALTRVREARRISPDSAQTYVLEGDILMLQGQAAAAARAYENAFARQRAGSTTIRMHGALDQLAKPIEAESVMRRWFEEHPADVSVRAYYGNHLLQQKKYREAASEYERVLTHNPNDADVLNNYAWVLDQIDDPRAKSVAERANAARPNSAAALDTMGMILVKRGEFVQGIDALQRALTLAPESGEVRYHLTQAWLKAGNRPKAVRELEVLLSRYKQFPQRDEAENLLKELNR